MDNSESKTATMLSSSYVRCGESLWMPKIPAGKERFYYVSYGQCGAANKFERPESGQDKIQAIQFHYKEHSHDNSDSLHQ